MVTSLLSSCTSFCLFLSLLTQSFLLSVAFNDLDVVRTPSHDRRPPPSPRRPHPSHTTPRCHLGDVTLGLLTTSHRTPAHLSTKGGVSERHPRPHLTGQSPASYPSRGVVPTDDRTQDFPVKGRGALSSKRYGYTETYNAKEDLKQNKDPTHMTTS